MYTSTAMLFDFVQRRLSSHLNQSDSLAIVDRLAQQMNDFILPLIWHFTWLVTSNNLTASINDKVCEIPFNITTFANFRVDHPIIQIVAIYAIDINFSHHVECNAEFVFDMSFYLLMSARLLTAKLIAWKGND